ncbi:MAG TPA: histidine triad nucleotide-binding protein [Syntrophales bacterium]|nr:histidine triad nucleotide-binding protein [Syntrophales bacterium]
MDDCIFCRIIKGEVPCNKVYEDDKVLAFHDINPAAPVHVIVIPKRHIPTLMDVEAGQFEYLISMLAAVPRIAKLKGIDQRGFKTIINCNKDGGQVIFHLHMHILGGKKLAEKLI